MIGLPRLTPWRWLLPPARGLTPASVVVVAALRSGTAACRSTMSKGTEDQRTRNRAHATRQRRVNERM
jgi:hypothetical protein